MLPLVQILTNTQLDKYMDAFSKGKAQLEIKLMSNVTIVSKSAVYLKVVK